MGFFSIGIAESNSKISSNVLNWKASEDISSLQRETKSTLATGKFTENESNAKVTTFFLSRQKENLTADWEEAKSRVSVSSPL